MFYCTSGYSGSVIFLFAPRPQLRILSSAFWRYTHLVGWYQTCRWSFLNPLLATSSFLFGTTLGIGHSVCYCRDVCDSYLTSSTSVSPPSDISLALEGSSFTPEHIYQGLQMVRLTPLLVNSVKNRIPSSLFWHLEWKGGKKNAIAV